MHIAFFNPQGNFDPKDSHWTEHPDFGGQLVYVKELALALGAQGHSVDILTRRILDDRWPEFAAPLDGYPDHPRVRIVRIPCGPPEFLPKEELWPCLGTEWVPGILEFYEREGRPPDVVTAHYADGGLSAALFRRQTGAPFTFTAHSLGAQKMDKLGVTLEDLAELDARFHFARRIAAERVAMSHAARIVTSTRQERFAQYGHCAYRGAVDVHDDGRFAVIPPGVNRTVFSPDPIDLDALIEERIEAALARDLPPERRSFPLVLCSSRLDRKKNHVGLVRAFAQSAELRRAANLALIVRGLDNPLRKRGELQGEERAVLDEIVSLLTRHDLWDVVTSFPLNSQGELAAAYRVGARRHWVFALVSLHEPFGLAPLEAMSCGLPVVVTRNGGPSESLLDEETGEYGVLVDPTDPADIARGLLQALAPEAWERYHRAGMERVQIRYTWEKTAKGYLDVLSRILREKPAPEESLLPIPRYFTDPRPENDLAPEGLAELYFHGDER
jgi:sucrose-phosphate synthase